MTIQEFSCTVVSAMNKMYYCKRKFTGRGPEFQLDLTALSPELVALRQYAMECLAQTRCFHLIKKNKTKLEIEVISENGESLPLPSCRGCPATSLPLSLSPHTCFHVHIHTHPAFPSLPSLGWSFCASLKCKQFPAGRIQKQSARGSQFKLVLLETRGAGTLSLKPYGR